MTTHQPRSLGASGLVVAPVGVGTNKWGTAGRDPEQIFGGFAAALDSGLTLIDTAEMYAGGNSEKVIGDFRRRDPRPAVVCSKYAPYPTRLSARYLLGALDASLQRLQTSCIDLYYIHFPLTFVGIEALMDAMAEAHRAGKIKAVGVSNYDAGQMRRAADRLARHGIPLAANEVHYSLLHRKPETNGVLDACRELNVALVAYFPLGSGRLKAPAANAPARSESPFARMSLRGQSAGLIGLQQTLQRIAAVHDGTASQAALNWLLQKDDRVIAIPGATRATHVLENAAALNWRLTAEEFEAIDAASLAAAR